jgi:hypothetical protein
MAMGSRAGDSTGDRDPLAPAVASKAEGIFLVDSKGLNSDGEDGLVLMTAVCQSEA